MAFFNSCCSCDSMDDMDARLVFQNTDTTEEQKISTDSIIGKEIKQIKLRIYSYRGCLNDDYHPRNLLQKGKKKCYGSAITKEFGHNGIDWIVFETVIEENWCSSFNPWKKKIINNAIYIPTQIRIRNFEKNSNQAIESLQVQIGQVAQDSSQFISLHSPNYITNIVEQDEKYQSFVLDAPMTDPELIPKIIENKWNHIKVQFTSNHGPSTVSISKYVCNEIKLYGYIA